MRIFLIIILAFMLNEALACKKAKPQYGIEAYPRGYLHKHYKHCAGQWYAKGCKCKTLKTKEGKQNEINKNHNS